MSESTIQAKLSKRSEGELRALVTSFSKEQIAEAFAADPYERNYLLNLRECETGADVLETYPWNVSLPIADICNARCTFCSSWFNGRNVMTPQQLDHYREVLPYTRMLGLVGHGEPLVNPQIAEILDELAVRLDPRATGYIITNGVHLAQYLDPLLKSCIRTYNISLNAVTPETHDKVMGLGTDKFWPIIETLMHLVKLRAKDPRIQITISMVMTTDNIHEAADFIELGNKLPVNWMYLRSLLPGGMSDTGLALNYHRQSPFLHPDYKWHAAQALNAIKNSAIRVDTQPETWGVDAADPAYRAAVERDPPPYVTRKQALQSNQLRAEYFQSDNSDGRWLEDVYDLRESPYNRTPPFSCHFVYHNLITTQLSFRMIPCCYINSVPGHRDVVLTEGPFMEMWNSPAMVNMRRRLRHGPLYQSCAKCPMQGQ